MSRWYIVEIILLLLIIAGLILLLRDTPQAWPYLIA